MATRIVVWLAVILVFVVGAYLLDIGRSASAGEDLVPWEMGMARGSELAQETGKPMLVNFTADWCPPCQQMKREVFSQPAVAEAITDGFVPVKVDLTAPAQGGPEEQAAMRYGVRGIPAYVVIDADGSELARTGPQGDRDMLAWLQRVQ